MFLPLSSASCSLQKVVAIMVIVTLFTSQNVTGGHVRARRLSVSPFLRDAEFENANQMRLRRTSTASVSAKFKELPFWNLEEDYVRPERHALKARKWINGTVPYTIDPGFTPKEQALIEKGFKEYAKKTCIRFVPKSSNHRDYVYIQLNNEVCGRATVCRQGGMQFVKFGRKCMIMTTVLHELGHSICLLHEHRRPDRDQFIELTENSDQISPNNEKADSRYTTTLKLLYDYKSVMHYDCPHFFKAKFSQVKTCGGGNELSILDAEKINSLYSCRGCHSYRFRQPDEAEKDIIETVGEDTDGKKLGICRGFLNADIIPGKYRLGEPECHIPWRKKEYKLTKNFEVLTKPRSGYFSWVYVENGQIPDNAVPGGRENGGIPLYIGRCITHFNGKNNYVPGKIDNGIMYYSFAGKEHTCQKFEAFVCTEKS